MKKVLFATTATTLLALSGAASAQGISLFGEARLGLIYDEGSDDELQTTSRVRFGVNMTGETNSGITFGATMRVDEATNPLDGTEDGREGSVFVSGSLGTLSFGDTNGADEQHVGDLPGNYTLTGLGDLNETFFVTNGGEIDSDSDFAVNPNARPTIRYDYDIAGFGLSASSNRALEDVSVGGSYTLDTGMGGFTLGLGYAKIGNFVIPAGAVLNTDGTITTTAEQNIGEIDSYSAALRGSFTSFEAAVIYLNNEGDNDTFETLGVGGSTTFGEFSVGAYYRKVLDSTLASVADDADTYGLSAEYDLGGGATVNGGVVKSYSEDDDLTADFGIKMAF